jgi:nucleotide-binding universal stress UspA family protein
MAKFNYVGFDTGLVQVARHEIAAADVSGISVTNAVPHFLCWCPSTNASAVTEEAYAFSFARLLDARLSFYRGSRNELSNEDQDPQPDLILFHSPASPLPAWLWPNPTEKRLLKRIPTSLLVMRGPRWPLQKILLVLRGSEFDLTAIAWMVQIVSKSSASVTVLPILAPAPPIFTGVILGQRSLVYLLNSDCSLGERLRQVFQYFDAQDIQGDLHFWDGTMVEQIQQEVEECNYDLIIIAADTAHSLLRWMLGELVNPLLGLSEVPILIAKPIQFLKGNENMNSGEIY